MVRKVKLDLLEIESDILTQMQIAKEPEAAPVGEEQEEITAPRGRRNKLLLLGSGLFLLLSVGVTLWYQFGAEKEAPVAQTVQSAPVAVPTETLEHFQYFAVDFKDAQGQYKVLLCDVMVELNPGSKLSLDTPNVRKVIYRTLHAKTIQELTVAKGKKAIKKDLEAALNQANGESSVKQVYFTKFTLI